MSISQVIFALVCMCTCLTAFSCIMVCVLYDERRKKKKEREQDEEVEREMGVAEKEATRVGSIDEGFENIMRYSVNGKTGFEQE